jgi:hypothetical protein
MLNKWADGIFDPIPYLLKNSMENRGVSYPRAVGAFDAETAQHKTLAHSA